MIASAFHVLLATTKDKKKKKNREGGDPNNDEVQIFPKLQVHDVFHRKDVYILMSKFQH